MRLGFEFKKHYFQLCFCVCVSVAQVKCNLLHRAAVLEMGRVVLRESCRNTFFRDPRL